MKKLIALLLAAVMCLSLAACGNNKVEENSDDSQEQDTEISQQDEEQTENTTDESEQAEEEPQEQIYSIGDTITIEDMFEFTPIFEGFANEVTNWPGENILTPNGMSSGNSNPFKADEEKIMMYFSGTIECIGNPKDNLSFYYSFSVEYNDDYIFSEGNSNGYDCVVTSDSTWKSFDNVTKMNGEGGNVAVFEPLSSNTTRYVRSCIMVPEILETDSESTLYVTYNINGNDYKFSLR